MEGNITLEECVNGLDECVNCKCRSLVEEMKSTSRTLNRVFEAKKLCKDVEELEKYERKLIELKERIILLRNQYFECRDEWLRVKNAEPNEDVMREWLGLPAGQADIPLDLEPELIALE